MTIATTTLVALFACAQVGPICVPYREKFIWVFGYDDQGVNVASTAAGPPVRKPWKEVPTDFIDALGWSTVSLGKHRDSQALDTTRDNMIISSLNLPDMYSHMSHGAQKVFLIPLRIYVPKSPVKAELVAAASKQERIEAGVPNGSSLGIASQEDLFLRVRILEPRVAHTTIVISEDWFLLPKVLKGEAQLTSTAYKYANFTDGTYTITPVVCKVLQGPTRHVAGMSAVHAAKRDPFFRLTIDGPQGSLAIYFAAFIGADGKLRIDGRIANINLDNKEDLRASTEKVSEAIRNAKRAETIKRAQLAGAKRRLESSRSASTDARSGGSSTSDPRAAFAFDTMAKVLDTRAESAAKGAETLEAAIERARMSQVALQYVYEYLNSLGGYLGMDYLLVRADGAVVEVAIAKEHLDALVRDEPSSGDNREQDGN